MMDFDPTAIIKDVFALLHKRGFRPGLGKYLDAIAAVEHDYGSDPDVLKSTLRLLWCQSHDERELFESLWEEVWESHAAIASQVRNSPRQDEAIAGDEERETLDKAIESQSSQREPSQERVEKPTQQFDFMPVRAPSSRILESEGSGELQEAFPISRRYMTYAWRYLRRLVPLGCPDVLDVEATVNAVAQQGFYLKPVYRRREINRTHLLLFIDREGSMIPFHRFVRALVETAREESGIERVSVFYFHNVVDDTVFESEYLAHPLPLRANAATRTALSDCDRDAVAAIVSDAGAARGRDRFERYFASTEFIRVLRQHLDTIIWLNPMPKERWRNSSAAKIAFFAPMFPLDPEGLRAAIDMARGQPTNRGR